MAYFSSSASINFRRKIAPGISLYFKSSESRTLKSATAVVAFKTNLVKLVASLREGGQWEEYEGDIPSGLKFVHTFHKQTQIFNRKDLA